MNLGELSEDHNWGFNQIIQVLKRLLNAMRCLEEHDGPVVGVIDGRLQPDVSGFSPSWRKPNEFKAIRLDPRHRHRRNHGACPWYRLDTKAGITDRIHEDGPRVGNARGSGIGDERYRFA